MCNIIIIIIIIIDIQLYFRVDETVFVTGCAEANSITLVTGVICLYNK
jgi:hypothetical protein